MLPSQDTPQYRHFFSKLKKSILQFLGNTVERNAFTYEEGHVKTTYRVFTVEFTFLSNGMTSKQLCRRLRSTDQCLLSVPKTRTKTCGSRSFKQVTPVLWNALPLDIKTRGCVFDFKRAKKTHLFESHYGPS